MKRLVLFILLLSMISCGHKDNTTPEESLAAQNEIILSSLGSINGTQDFSAGELKCRVMDDGDKVLIIASIKSHGEVFELFQVTDTSEAIKTGDETDLTNGEATIPAVHYVAKGEMMHFALKNTEKCEILYTNAVSQPQVRGRINCSTLSHGESDQLSLNATFSCSKDDSLEPEVTAENHASYLNL